MPSVGDWLSLERLFGPHSFDLPVLCSGTSGRSDVSASKYFLPYSAFDPQVSRPWKAARRCPTCLYPNDIDANFCQACGSQTSLKKIVVPTKTIDHAKIAKRFQ